MVLKGLLTHNKWLHLKALREGGGRGYEGETLLLWTLQVLGFVMQTMVQGLHLFVRERKAQL